MVTDHNKNKVNDDKDESEVEAKVDNNLEGPEETHINELRNILAELVTDNKNEVNDDDENYIFGGTTKSNSSGVNSRINDFRIYNFKISITRTRNLRVT